MISYLCIKNTLVHATTGIALCGLQSGSVQSLDSQAALLQERSLGTRLGKERLLVRPHVLGYWLQFNTYRLYTGGETALEVLNFKKEYTHVYTRLHGKL